MENLKHLAAHIHSQIDQFMTLWAQRINDRIDREYQRREAKKNQRLR